MALSEPSKSSAVDVCSVGVCSVGCNVAPKELGSLKSGDHVLLLDAYPCKLVEVKFAAPGKHGARKAMLTGLDVFTKCKHTHVGPADHKVWAFELKKLEWSVIDVDTINNTVSALDAENQLQTLDVEHATAHTIDKLVNRQQKTVTVQLLCAPAKADKNGDFPTTLRIASFKTTD